MILGHIYPRSKRIVRKFYFLFGVLCDHLRNGTMDDEVPAWTLEWGERVLEQPSTVGKPRKYRIY